MSKLVITIARGFGSGGRTIGKMLAQRLDCNCYDNDLIKLASEESGINLELFGKADEKVKTSPSTLLTNLRNASLPSSVRL